MTLPEFEELANTVLALAAGGDHIDDLSELSRVTLLGLLVQEYTVRMPSELAAYREAVHQQQTLTEAVTLAAKLGKLQTHLTSGEPS